VRKQSVFVRIGWIFLLCYTLYGGFSFLYHANEFFEQYKKDRIESASSFTKVGRVLLKDNGMFDLQDRLVDAVNSNQIDFFMLGRGENLLASANAAGPNDVVNSFPLSSQEGWYSGSHGEFGLYLIHENGYSLAVGVKIGPMVFLNNLWKLERMSIFREIFLVALGVVFLVMFSFRDLRSLLGKLRVRGVKRGDISLANTRETMALVKGLKGFENQVETLTQENELLRGQVLSALQKELGSKKTPPYEFTCTLVRTDINNFTTIFSNHNHAEFMGVINQFFIGVTEIVSRYGGYVYEFIGDEVLFYFKDEDHVNSSLMALSALRDINQLALQTSEQTESAHGYIFRVKSSLSCGTILFGPLVNGFSLAGNPLIETVRMLSHVHEKSENTILFGDEVDGASAGVCRSKPFGLVMLKGMKGSRHLHVYDGHVPLSLHLRQENTAWANLSYYRSDSDIAEILKYLGDHLEILPQDAALSFYRELRKFKVAKASSFVKGAFADHLEKLVSDIRPNEQKEFLLATCITVATSLLRPADLQGRLKDLLMRCLEHTNKRVVANVLDVFSELTPDASDSAFESTVLQADNRIAANALVKQGKREWNAKTARKVSVMLKSKSPYFKASGLFALGEIAAYLMKTDEVAFRSDSTFSDLAEKAFQLSNHANKMVRRQAMKCVVKCDEAARLQSALNSADLKYLTDEMKQEIRETLQASAQFSDSEGADGDQGAPKLQLVKKTG
jgi:class 3 adenylate cyclase